MSVSEIQQLNLQGFRNMSAAIYGAVARKRDIEAALDMVGWEQERT